MGRLNDGSPDGGSSFMRPGDVRTMNAKDKDGSILRTYTLTRTTRPYVEDLCDAYNKDLGDSPIRWVVTPGGELKLTHDLNWSRHNLAETKRTMEAERRQFNERRAAHDRDQRRDAA